MDCRFIMLDTDDAPVAGTPTVVTSAGMTLEPVAQSNGWWMVDAVAGLGITATLDGARPCYFTVPLADPSALSTFDHTTDEVTPTEASKTGYSGVATNMVAEAPSASTIATAMRTELQTELGRIDENISAAKTLTQAERVSIADVVEAEIINDTDSEKVLQAIVDKIAAANPSLEDLTLAAIASAIRTELGPELTLIDAAISSRLAASGYSAAPSAAVVAGQVRTELGPELGRIDANISSRLAHDDYVEPDNVGILSISTSVGIITGLLDTEIASILAVANKIDTTLEVDGLVYKFTANALENGSAATITPKEIWEYIDRTLTSSMAPEDIETLAQSIYDELMSAMSLAQGLSVGPGTGDYLFEDTLTGRNGIGIGNAIVRVYPFDTEARTTDWASCKGSYTTNDNGTYHLHLDAGTYTRRVWKNGTVILDDRITIG